MINLQPYSNPSYFVILIVTLLPAMIGLYFGKRLKIYEAIWTFVFLVLTFGGDKFHQGIALIGYLIFETLLVIFYRWYHAKNNQTGMFYGVIILSILPLVLVKLAPVFSGSKLSLLGFLGISYLTFKVVQVLMEIRDGVLKNLSVPIFIQFLLFFPTISSGPIDRYRRFATDYNNVPSKGEYLSLIEKSLHYLFLGFLYKFVLGYIFGTLMLPKLQQSALGASDSFFGTGISIYLVGVMYVYSMYLFFDFAGYSLFAIGISYLLGIKSPVNFNQPFKAHNIKDFWNRWHMSLSFWFRDYVFMRVTFFIMKNRLIKNKIRVSQVAYLINFLVMGFWHGVTWFYIVYGLFHAVAIIINDYWLRYKKQHLQIKHTRMTEAVATFITFNVVCFSFLIFSGFLNTLWFNK